MGTKTSEMLKGTDAIGVIVRGEGWTKELPLLMNVNLTRKVFGNRSRTWVYDRLEANDFESVLDGGRRLIVTESALAYLNRLRGETAFTRNADESLKVTA